MMGRKQLARVTLRLTDEEREQLKILNAALKVSEYTDDVDNVRLTYRRDDAMLSAMIDLFTTLTGLSVISNDLPQSVRDALKSKDVEVRSLEPVLQRFFEVGRRFKRMNPDKMRSEYGKLVMLLQDAARPGIRRSLNMELIVPVRTVGATLKAIDAFPMLDDPQLAAAVMPLPPGYAESTLAAKNKAIAEVIERHSKGDAARARTVELCLRSIGDAIALVETNRALVRKMIDWLTRYFGPGAPSPREHRIHDLTISRGQGGSMLSHTHASQFAYVKEALTLWDIVQRDIFDFWTAVEDDMLISNAGYQMRNTGQGIHRVSAGPQTAGLMAAAVQEADRLMGGWVGIKVVHMGDQDVPNPLVFIDKYTIIPRLLAPIVQTVEQIELEFGLAAPRPTAAAAVGVAAMGDDDGAGSGDGDAPTTTKAAAGDAAVTAAPMSDAKPDAATQPVARDSAAQDAPTAAATTAAASATAAAAAAGPRAEKYPGFRELLLTGFPDARTLVVSILRDFFRHGFDGSGDDGGSCIDGRLTSAWNWCSELHKKPYYQAFLLTGFVGFDANYA
jgi:hypothetical protein